MPTGYELVSGESMAYFTVGPAFLHMLSYRHGNRVTVKLTPEKALVAASCPDDYHLRHPTCSLVGLAAALPPVRNNTEGCCSH